ncbi:Uncharacterised protein [Chlamydia trachomatis]|nr:Uncharacterised protein [Chlamydia trachomatis]
MVGEADAEVLHLKERCRLGRRGEAVVALLLDALEGVEAGLEGLGLLGVRSARIEEETVGLTLRIRGDLGDGRTLGGGDHGVGNALGEDVEAEDGRSDDHAWEEGGPPLAEHDRQVRGGFGQDVAPGWNHRRGQS